MLPSCCDISAVQGDRQGIMSRKIPSNTKQSTASNARLLKRFPENRYYTHSVHSQSPITLVMWLPTLRYFYHFFFYGSWLKHLISFIFNISFLFKKKYIYINIAPRHKVIDNNLSIKEVTLDDGGLYVCRATQSNPMIADFREMNITLKIQRKCAHRRLHFSPCIDFFLFLF